MRTGLRRGALRLDLEDLPAAEHAAMRTRLVRGLRALALGTRHEILRLQRQMAATLALRGMRDPFLGMTSQSLLSLNQLDSENQSDSDAAVARSARETRPALSRERPERRDARHCMGEDDMADRGLRRVSRADRAAAAAVALAGGLLALVADLFDLFLMDAIGGVEDSSGASTRSATWPTC